MCVTSLDREGLLRKDLWRRKQLIYVLKELVIDIKKDIYRMGNSPCENMEAQRHGLHSGKSK